MVISKGERVGVGREMGRGGEGVSEGVEGKWGGNEVERRGRAGRGKRETEWGGRETKRKILNI